jgi:hypothetical protein
VAVSKTQVQARLLDVLLSKVVLPPLPPITNVLSRDEMFGHNAALRPLLDGAVCVEASNVARFFDNSYVGIEGAFDESFWTDLKCLVPPYKKFFIEWTTPLIETALRMGTLFLACPPDLAESVARSFIGMGAKSTPAKIVEFRKDLRCKWIYITLDFLEFPFQNDGTHVSGLRGPYHIGAISVAQDGSLLNFWMSHATAQLSKNESMQVAAASLVGWTTLSMMNCANIDTIEHKAPEAFQKARVKSGKLPLVSYRTVRVEASKTPRQIAAPSLPGDGTTPRLHKKRGHLKDYRRGKGLFGRYKGVWFWGDMTAGSAEKGIVETDYEVTP